MSVQPVIPQDANNQTLACLSVQGSKAEDRWRRPLREGERIVLGRAPDAWQMPWERFLSAEHVELVWQAGILKGRKLPEARNPIYLAGRPVEEFELRPGDYFVVGETIVLVTQDEKRPAEQAAASPMPVVPPRKSSSDVIWSSGKRGSSNQPKKAKGKAKASHKKNSKKK